MDSMPPPSHYEMQMPWDHFLGEQASMQIPQFKDCPDCDKIFWFQVWLAEAYFLWKAGGISPDQAIDICNKFLSYWNSHEGEFRQRCFDNGWDGKVDPQIQATKEAIATVNKTKMFQDFEIAVINSGTLIVFVGGPPHQRYTQGNSKVGF